MLKDYPMHPTVIQNPERFARYAKKAIEQGLNEVCVTDPMQSFDRIYPSVGIVQTALGKGIRTWETNEA